MKFYFRSKELSRNLIVEQQYIIGRLTCRGNGEQVSNIMVPQFPRKEVYRTQGGRSGERQLHSDPRFEGHFEVSSLACGED